MGKFDIYVPVDARVMLASVLLSSACSVDPRDEGDGISGGADSATETAGQTGASSASGGTGSGDTGQSSDGSDDGGDAIKLDVGPFDAGDGVVPGCSPAGGGMGGGAPEIEFSYIWIANTSQGTVSKIDTMTGVEVSRFYTGAEQSSESDPSRTSVNLAGDAVVTNRMGGAITKFAAIEDRCNDNNNNGVIDTSHGPDDIRPFGEDECMLWHVDLPVPGGVWEGGARATAWDAGPNNDPCDPDSYRVWVGWAEPANDAVHFYRLQGTDGSVLDDVTAHDWGWAGIGAYGGAVDQDGNLWFTGGPLGRIDAQTTEVDRWEFPDNIDPYGMGLDKDGHVWTGSMAGDVVHFDPGTEQFEVFHVTTDLRGLQIDRDGFAWIAKSGGDCGLVQFDTIAKTVVNAGIDLYDCRSPVGVSIDVEGYVWVPDQHSDLVYKVDPQTLEASITTGLQSPYTYSDMTGAGLALVYDPPAG